MNTIYVTNWSSKAMYGPGRLLTIMANPRHWEHGEGSVPALTPPSDLVGPTLKSMKAHEESGCALCQARTACPFMTGLAEAYRTTFDAQMTRFNLAPGFLSTNIRPRGGPYEVVRDNDTVLCNCARHKAALGYCHRAMAVPFLRRAGWDVVFDGVHLASSTVESR